MESLKGKHGNTEIEIIISDNAISNNFKIGKSTDLQMILTDVFNDQYQADVCLKNNWIMEDLQQIVVNTILNCPANIIKIKATILGSISAN